MNNRDFMKRKQISKHLHNPRVAKLPATYPRPSVHNPHHLTQQS
jgi:hypothetical protein